MSGSASAPPRAIRLRRPARIVVDESRFVPAVPLAQVDEAWDALVRENPRYTDGACLHITGVHRDGHGGATVHAVHSSYRMGAVRRLGVHTGFRGLGTKAIAHAGGRVLMGLRSAHVQAYPGQWEFAPGGGVEIGEPPEAGIVRELVEECGVEAAAPARAIALIFDPVAGAWEIVHDLRISQPPDAAPSWEYAQLQMHEPSALPEPLSACTRQMACLLPWTSLGLAGPGAVG